MRAKEIEDKTSATERRLMEMEAKLAEREATAAADAEVSAFFKRMSKIATKTEDAPLTKQYLTSNPKAAREALARTAQALAQKHNLKTLPSAKAVIAAHEKSRRRELRDMGVDVEALSAGKGTTADKATAAKAKSTVAVKSTDKPKNGSNGATDGIRIPTKAEILAEMETGEIDLS